MYPACAHHLPVNRTKAGHKMEIDSNLYTHGLVASTTNVEYCILILSKGKIALLNLLLSSHKYSSLLLEIKFPSTCASVSSTTALHSMSNSVK